MTYTHLTYLKRCQLAAYYKAGFCQKDIAKELEVSASTISRELDRMGVKVEESEDKLIISHCDNIMGIKVNHENDHRIAMALLIASLFANTTSEIEDIVIVKDSYPEFLNDLIKLGAQIKLK